MDGRFAYFQCRHERGEEKGLGVSSELLVFSRFHIRWLSYCLARPYRTLAVTYRNLQIWRVDTLVPSSHKRILFIPYSEVSIWVPNGSDLWYHTFSNKDSSPDFHWRTLMLDKQNFKFLDELRPLYHGQRRIRAGANLHPPPDVRGNR